MGRVVPTWTARPALHPTSRLPVAFQNRIALVPTAGAVPPPSVGPVAGASGWLRSSSQPAVDGNDQQHAATRWRSSASITFLSCGRPSGRPCAPSPPEFLEANFLRTIIGRALGPSPFFRRGFIRPGACHSSFVWVRSRAPSLKRRPARTQPVREDSGVSGRFPCPRFRWGAGPPVNLQQTRAWAPLRREGAGEPAPTADPGPAPMQWRAGFPPPPPPTSGHIGGSPPALPGWAKVPGRPGAPGTGWSAGAVGRVGAVR